MKKEKILYKIIDKNEIEIPLKNGKYRTYDEAINLLTRLNCNGDYRPYKMVKVKYAK